MNTNRVWQSQLVFIAGVAMLALTYFGNPEVVWSFAREDGAVENLTALAYGVGILAAVLAIIARRYVRMAVAWLALCLLFLGEEVSWFQRVFEFSVPSVEAINAQGEFNLHNLGQGEQARILDENGNFELSLERFINSQNLFRLGFGLFFLVVPLLWSFSARARRVLGAFHYLRPSNSFMLAIWAVVAVSFALVVISPEITRNSLAEVREFFYALVIALYVFTLYAAETLAGLVARGGSAEPGGVARFHEAPAPDMTR